MGDLTFLHDVTGLVIGPHEPRPDLTIVVSNNDGGAIFSTLEPGAAAARQGLRPGLRHPARGRCSPAWSRAAASEHVFVSTADELADAHRRSGRDPGGRGADLAHGLPCTLRAMRTAVRAVRL